MISLMISQVANAEAALKMKIRPVNAFFQCYNFAYLSGLPREELHQFLVGLYGEYIAAQARVHPQLLRQGCQQISGDQWHARWIRRHRSLKWPLNMPPISTTCMVADTQGNILLAIGFVSCSWTFLFCFATWLLQRWCDVYLHWKCSIILIQMTSHVIS